MTTSELDSDSEDEGGLDSFFDFDDDSDFDSASMTWLDLPFSDAPLKSAVLYASGKHGGELLLRIRSGQLVRVSALRFRMTFGGPVDTDVSGYDDVSVQIDYRADDLRLLAGRVGMPSASDEDAAEFRELCEQWLTDTDMELELTTDAEFRFGCGRAAAAQA